MYLATRVEIGETMDLNFSFSEGGVVGLGWREMYISIPTEIGENLAVIRRF